MICCIKVAGAYGQDIVHDESNCLVGVGARQVDILVDILDGFSVRGVHRRFFGKIPVLIEPIQCHFVITVQGFDFGRNLLGLLDLQRCICYDAAPFFRCELHLSTLTCICATALASGPDSVGDGADGANYDVFTSFSVSC